MPALIFDCDGVLADTELFGHLPAFNQMFAENGLPVSWSEADYAVKVLIGGGKERLASILTPSFVAEAGLPTDPEEQAALVLAWHRRKTQIYTELVASGVMPARPGIERITDEASSRGFQLAVASTSAEPAVRAVLEHAVGPGRAAEFSVFAGDVVPAKKPAPDIYLHALAELGLAELGLGSDGAVVVEDSANGLAAARAAGLRTVITVSSFTADEDFTGASLVVTSLGDPPPGERGEVLQAAAGVVPDGFVSVDDLLAVLRSPLIPSPSAQEARS